MNFDADKKTISTLLNSKKKFEIPRFQREYSWEKPQWEEFFNDIINRIEIDENKNLCTTEYFWGSTLFVGNFTDANCKSMHVVDGQQRLTTITIYLSCIRKAFLKISMAKLAELTQSYIMSTDDNGNEYAILVNETPYPYFQNYVQSINTQDDEAVSEEEINIKKAVEFFDKKLNSKNLKDFFLNKYNKEFSSADILKALRDQLLHSVIIAISTQDKHQANMIFEILNAKGKSLDQIDLIKNQIFSVLKKEQPSDDAKCFWNNIKKTLYSREFGVDISVFLNHYWASKYGKLNYKKLFSTFKTKIRANEESYIEFLNDLEKHAEYYVKITNPKTDDFNNRIEYRLVYQYLNFLNDLNIKQGRILILSLFEMIDNNILTCSVFINCLKNLCSFHLIYNGLYSQRTNILEKLYSNTAVDLRKSRNNGEIKIILNKLYEDMGKLLEKNEINTDSLLDRIKHLQYSTKLNLPDNLKSKFIIRMIYEIKSAYPADASIEHIENESSGNEFCLYLGNLIPLEQIINSSIPQNTDFIDKTRKHYIKSYYYMITDFLNENHQSWTKTDIETRGRNMALSFIENYLKDFKIFI